MKANELMIGDWVIKHNPRENIFSYQRVTAISNTIGLCTDNKLTTFDLVEPIPLTAEILEKNGFVGDFRSAFAYGQKGAYLIDLYAEVGEIRIYDEKGHYNSGYVCRSINVPSLYYVHELQHALRLCGLTDLADNFKI